MSFDLSSIGQILKEKREEKGMSIEDIATKLSLRKVIVKAIESGNWEILPHQIYVKGYVKDYARTLNISKDIEQYLIEIKENKEQEKPVENPPEQKERSNILKNHSKTITIYLIGFVVIALFLVFLGKQKGPAAISEWEKKGQVLAEVANDTKRNIPDLPHVKKLMITCHDKTWISLVIDGAEKKEFILHPEEVASFNGNDKFDLLVGNAGGINVFLNGKDVGFTGGDQEVKRLTLS